MVSLKVFVTDSWRRGGAYMHFNLSIPFAQRPLLLRRYILVPEEDDAPFGDKQT